MHLTPLENRDTVPVISVIIPAFNRLQTLPRALDSVLSQSHNPLEIIVVDDGSTDDTIKHLGQQYPDVVFLSQNNGGVSSARNTGIKHASGNWIALLDSDDEWLPNKLQKQLLAVTQQPDSVLCHSDEIWIRNGKRVNPMNKHKKQGGNIFKQCLPLCAISPSAALIKKELLTDIGLFDESLPACEDYDLWLRICSRHPVLYIDEYLLNKYGGHADQLSRQFWGMDRFRVQALAKLIEGGSLQPDDRNSAMNTLVEKCLVLVQGAIKRGNQETADHYYSLATSYEIEQDSADKLASSFTRLHAAVAGSKT